MKTTIGNVLAILSVACFALLAPPSVLSAPSARDIMAKVDRVSRESYITSIVKMKLTTCKYAVRQGRMHCTENPRVSVLENIQKHCGTDNKDSRSIAIVLEPISDKGIGMLTYEYDAPDKDNDSWLYLSALGKVKRIISNNKDGDESGSFFGTEFSIEDMELRKVDDYMYKIIGEEIYAEQSVWIIESVPTRRRSALTKYGKSVSWIDKEKNIILKTDLYDRQGNLYKQRIMRNVEYIDDVWIARKVTMNNLFTRRATNMELLSTAFNMRVPDEFLTQRSLKDFAFRERNLAAFRGYLK